MAEMTLNIKKTHSERLMPLLDQLLTESGIEREQLGAIAVAAGPGSFTGLRIGVSTARGLAQALNIPAVPVCTLIALAEVVPTPGALICPLLDARRNQAYTSLYRRSAEPPFSLETLIAPAALSLDQLIETVLTYDQPIIFTGEGLQTYAATLAEKMPAKRAVLAPAPFRLCKAALVALCGQRLLKENPQASYLQLLPQYLRRPEAERLFDERQGGLT